MLSIRQNFLETIHGGNPDRFVNQFEYMATVRTPIGTHCGDSCERGTVKVNDWGATIQWPAELPGPFPMHDEAHIVMHDISEWKSIIHRPDPSAYSQEEWNAAEKQARAINKEEQFLAVSSGGILEKLIMLMGMVDGLTSFITEPESTFEFIDFLADWEIDCGKEVLKHFQPDMMFHHDDWGSQTRLFLSPETFKEFILPAYKKVYGFWRDNGVDVIVHHSDSYAAELVPYMIEMGVDVFQGGVSENNIPALVKKYGGQISFHAGLDNGKFDIANWSKDAMRKELERIIEECGGKYLIPGLTMGGPGSSFPGVYEACSEIIDDLSKKYFC